MTVGSSTQTIPKGTSNRLSSAKDTAAMTRNASRAQPAAHRRQCGAGDEAEGDQGAKPELICHEHGAERDEGQQQCEAAMG